MTNDEFRITKRKRAPLLPFVIRHSSFVVRGAFTLVEVMVVVALLSLIVLALMAVFDSTQKAFRASVTQTDLLEGGRAAMDLMANDIREMAPSGGNGTNATAPINFCVTNNPNNLAMIQPMVPPGSYRTNILEDFFILSRGNIGGHDSWIGVGYAVVTNSPDGLYSLYRCETNHPVITNGNPFYIFGNEFISNFLAAPTNFSHLMDGVVDLRVEPYDLNGQLIVTNKYKFVRTNVLNYVNPDVKANGRFNAGTGYRFYGNLLPASVEIEMGVFEDQELRRAEARPVSFDYLVNRAAQVHIFRQRVMIPNMDSEAYKQ